MAHDSPPYPKMCDWELRMKDGKVFGPPHPIDGGDYAPLDTASGNSPDFSAEVVKRWNIVSDMLATLQEELAALKTWERFVSNRDMLYGIRISIEKIRAAIAKATKP